MLNWDLYRDLIETTERYIRALEDILDLPIRLARIVEDLDNCGAYPLLNTSVGVGSDRIKRRLETFYDIRRYLERFGQSK